MDISIFIPGMIKRLHIDRIIRLLEIFPAVAMMGARQVGKTTSAKELVRKLKRKAIYFDLESREDLQRFSDPSGLLQQYRDRLVIIDEVQRMPELFAILRPEIDAHRIAGRFLLLGSASPELVRGVSESLAGRIAYFKIHPVNFPEANKHKIGLRKHWFRGGFPEPLLMKQDVAFRQWMQHFISSFVERDLQVLFGTEFSRTVLRNFISMLGHNHGGLFNAEAYARSLGVNKGTVNRYLDYLEGAFLITRLAPWYMNIRKRIVKSNRVYLSDSGMVHYLNRVEGEKELSGHFISGASWEGYVIAQVESLKPDSIDLFFYRTHNGAECDLILVSGIKPVAAIEIKVSGIPDISRGFFSSITDLGTAENFLITPHSESYLYKGVRVCSLQEFLTIHLPRFG